MTSIPESARELRERETDALVANLREAIKDRKMPIRLSVADTRAILDRLDTSAPADGEQTVQMVRFTREMQSAAWHFLGNLPGGRGEQISLHDIELMFHAMRQTLPSAPDSAPADVGELTHRHVKTGHLVREIGRGFAQVSVHPIEEMTAVSIYEHDGRLWVRNAVEFDDGRFDALARLSRAAPGEDPYQELHLYEGDSALVIREHGNKTLYGVQLPELLAHFERAAPAGDGSNVIGLLEHRIGAPNVFISDGSPHDSYVAAPAGDEVVAAWGRVIDGKAVTISMEKTPANDEPLYSASALSSSKAREAELRAKLAQIDTERAGWKRWTESAEQALEVAAALARLSRAADGPAPAVSEAEVEAAAQVIADSPLIDAPKLPAPCWRGLARACLEAAQRARK